MKENYFQLLILSPLKRTWGIKVNKKGFRGWKDVLSFTFIQSIKKTGYKAVTTVVSFLIIAVITAVIVIMAYNDDKDMIKETTDYVSPLQTVYVIDESGYLNDFHLYAASLEGALYKDIEFIYVEDDGSKDIYKNWLADASNNQREAGVIHVTLDEGGYVIGAYIPDGSSYAEGDLNMLASHMLDYFGINKLVHVMTGEQAAEILKPVMSSFITNGEDESVAVILIKMLGPMVFGLILYMMLLLYGQNISKDVSIEKSSKLVDTLLVTVHPNALISGKVLAVAGAAVLQFFIWIISVIVGFMAGNAVTKVLYPAYENSIITFVGFLRDNIGEAALSLPSVLLAIVIFCLGFLFYSFLAGFSGCMIGRPDEASSAAMFFQLPVIASWMLSYFSPLLEKEALTKVLRYIPLTAPFSVPIDLISGTIEIWQGLIIMVILIIFTFLVINLSVRVYKGLVLYNGQKISLKLIGKILKAS